MKKRVFTLGLRCAVLSTLFLVLFACQLFSQELEVLDTNPPSVKWSQVNTPYFRVLFPNGFDAQAMRVANTLEYIREAESKSLGKPPRLITIILQNQSSISNGFVSVLPRRSEFYTMPGQDYNFMGTNDWLNLLASHEFRHIVQYQHATRGFNRLFYYLFGSTTMAGFAHVAVPQWFWEGDGVVAETAFTRSGRGKIPNFGLVFRTNLLEGRTFNYHKQFLRSYKHNIPDHYVLGYHMVSYLRKKTNDPDIWEKITARSWNYPFLPFVFSRSIKKRAGSNVTTLYREMAADLKKQWQQQIDTISFTTFNRLDVKRKGYTDFNYPQQIADGSIIVMRTGIGEIATFVKADDRTTKIFTPGVINDSGMLSAQGSTIVWNETGYDPRWNVRNYSLIKAYDLKRKKRLVIGGNRGRYTSAAISPDETKIVAARTTSDYQTQLVVLSYPEGRILKEFPNPDNDFYSMARWSDDGQQVVSLKTNAKGRAIVGIDYQNGTEKVLLPFGEENVGYPVLFQRFLLFNSPVSGIDNIHAVDLETGIRYQVTSSKYGAYNPLISKDGKVLYYNDQSRNGLDVVSVPFDPSAWKVFASREPEDVMYRHLIAQEGDHYLFTDIPQRNLTVTKFSKASGLFNPYAWGFFVNNTLTQGNFGITSQDVLSTTIIEAGYNFDVNERTSTLQARVSYQGLYPIIDISGGLAERSVDLFFNDTNFKFKWRETNLEAGLRVPLITTSSKFLSRVDIGAALGLTEVTGFTNTFNGGSSRNIDSLAFFHEYLGNGTLIYSKSTFSASRLLKRSRRDINSKWGQTLEINHYDTPGKSLYFGSLISANAVLYFPGLMRHHSFWGYVAAQRRDISIHEYNYVFRSQIPMPRGFGVSPFQYFYAFSGNYAMPVWYPDIAVGPVINFQRLRTNVFYDYGYGERKEDGFSRVYNSIGIEAKLDVNFFRLLPQFEVGVRFTQGITPQIQRIEFLVGSINL